jgi:outer membrane receptor protein involved in Fe transport
MWRYISSVEDLNSTQVDFGARHYFDLAAIWNYNEYTSLRVGVNNLFDKAPPLTGNAAGPSIQGNGNTFPGLYDALGRYWFVGMSVGLS